MTHPVENIVSGGQTGVDRSGPDACLAFGGWCPRGRRAGDGPIPERHPPDETASAACRVRVRPDARGGDATLILCRGPLVGGAHLAAASAPRRGCPLRLADLSRRARAPGIGVEARRFPSRVLAP